MWYQRVKIIDHAICTDGHLKQVVIELALLARLTCLNRGEVGFRNLGELDVRDPNLSRHLVDRNTDALVFLIEVFNLGCIFFISLLGRLDQIFNILFKLANPDLLIVSPTMTKVVADDAVLGIRSKFFLSLLIKRMEDDYCEGRRIFFVYDERCA